MDSSLHKTMLTFVSATRLSRSEFETSSPLALSLRKVGQLTPLRLHLVTQNTRPLAETYNAAIEACGPDEQLVFVHDDVSLDDWLAGPRLGEALSRFDVVGVVGNRRDQSGQETWYMQPGKWVDGVRVMDTRDRGYLSGAVAHGPVAGANVSVYGPTPQPVALLDGLLLAANGMRLKTSGVRFDPALAFHLYDLDFCRSARQAGLTLGTWPIAVTHTSSGDSLRSEPWQAACAHYLRKWA